MKKLLLSVFLLAVLAGCEKTDYEKLEGTTWRAETQETLYTLNFVDESVCTIFSTPNDLTCAGDNATYSWKYTPAHYSQWGLFLLQDDEGNQYAAGTVENKTLYLSIYSNIDEPIRFKRQN